MSAWTRTELDRIGQTEELTLASVRRNGSRRRPVTMWVVCQSNDVYVRSVNGRGSSWFRGAQTRHEAHVRVGGIERDVELVETDERALELAVEYLPSLAGFREAIRSALLQEKFAENQVLPQLNLGAQIGTTESAGHAVCTVFTSLPKPLLNCNSPLGNDTGIRVPFGGIYGSALNKLWNFTFYNYAAVMSFQYPLDNAVARAALAQSRILYEASRLNYRAALSQAVVSVQTALANLHADEKRAQATEEATYYARQALHDEEVRFRVGMATTHDLLQFQEEEVSAEGNQVQAETDFENAKLALRHNEGTLLEEFGIEFQIQDPHETPWYATF